MPREISRRTSGPPERKGAIRPDIPGLRQLDESIVEDRPDPAIRLGRRLHPDPREEYHREAIQRDRYLGQFRSLEGGK